MVYGRGARAKPRNGNSVKAADHADQYDATPGKGRLSAGGDKQTRDNW